MLKPNLFRLLTAVLAATILLSACTASPKSKSDSQSASSGDVSPTSPQSEIVFDPTLTLRNPLKSSEASDLFYSNSSYEKGPLVGDPFLYYDEDSSTFYLYGTTRKYSNPGKITETFEFFTSKDLNHWEKGGTCFKPTRTDWCNDRLWAPEVYKIDGKYYMYYTAAKGNGTLHGSVAVADSPAGPFTNKISDKIDGKSAIFNFGENFPTIDGTLFIDDDGSLYYYFVRDQIGDNASSGGNNSTVRSTLWGIELENPYTIKSGASPVKLTEVGRSKVDETGRFTQSWETRQGMWNEGPFVLKHDGTYYLTYSANYWGSPYYSVGYATSKSPLSGFVKGKDAQIMGVRSSNKDNWDYFMGTGHAMFLTVAGENYFVYHTLMPNTDAYRHFTIDTFGYREDGSLYINGPTVSAQKVPDAVSGLTNVASKATISIDGGPAERSGCLTDGMIGAGIAHSENELILESGGKITLTFESPIKLSALIVANSADYARIFTNIDSVELNGGKYKIDNVKTLTDSFDAGSKQVYAGSSAIVELDHPVPVNEITLIFTSDSAIAISEIQLLAEAD